MKSIYIFSVAVALAGHAVADAVDTNAAENATGAAETTRQVPVAAASSERKS